ncbi:MAG: type 1 glutamine amidotransferase domain-containing protein [Sulfolobales archaeon]|jgi:protease I|nr:type 1 glutamine amidotransferase [Desulfurococcaceae archaeon]
MSTLVRRVGPGTKLKGKKVVFIVANEFEDVELLYPFIRLSEEGAEVIIVPMKVGLHPRPADPSKPVTGRFGTPVPLLVFREGERHVLKELKEVSVDEIDAVVIPGGFSPDYLRRLPEVLSFVREAYQKGKIVAAICHGPWVLISAGITKGKRMTGVIAVRDDIINSGAIYEDAPVVRDGNLITARVPDDLPEFCQAIINALSS